MSDYPSDYGWSGLDDECDMIGMRRSQEIEAAIKNNSCHHFDSSGDYLVGRWIMVTEIIDERGGRRLAVLGSPGLEPWEAIGMVSGLVWG